MSSYFWRTINLEQSLPSFDKGPPFSSYNPRMPKDHISVCQPYLSNEICYKYYLSKA